MSLASRYLAATAAIVVMACGLPGAARAGGLASLCAEYETRSVVGIIEDLLTEVDDCVRVAAAPGHSPRPVPRPVLLATAPPAFVPLTRIVTAATGTPVLVGSGGTPTTGGGGGPRTPFLPIIGGGGGEPTGTDKIEQGGGENPPPSPPEVELPAVPLPGSGALLALGLVGAAGVRAAHRPRRQLA